MAKVITKKKWFQLVAPKLFNEQIIGETPTTEAKSLVGKAININLAVLTEDIRKQNIIVNLVIDSVDGSKAKTELIGLNTVPTSIKRLVRKGRTRLDQTIKAITKDDKIVTIKILLIARNLIQGAAKSGLQKETKRLLIKTITSSTYSELSEGAVYGKLSKDLKERLNKIYPLKICDIKAFKLERFVKAAEQRRIKTDVAHQLKKNSRRKETDEDGNIKEEAEEKKPEEEAVEETEEVKSEESQEEPVEETQEETEQTQEESTEEEAQEEVQEEAEETQE